MLEQPVQRQQWKQRRIPIGESTDPESFLSQETAESDLAIAPEMLECGVVVGKEPLVRGHGDDHAAAGPQDASHLGHCTGIVLYVLQNI